MYMHRKWEIYILIRHNTYYNDLNTFLKVKISRKISLI